MFQLFVRIITPTVWIGAAWDRSPCIQCGVDASSCERNGLVVPWPRGWRPWSLPSILSNSSMQHIPLSANISAPASMQCSPVSTSFPTVAVKPAADDDFPEVYTAAWQKSRYIFEKLRLGTRRVTNDQNIDVTP